MKRLLLGSLLSCMVVSQVSCGIWDLVRDYPIYLGIEAPSKAACATVGATLLAGGLSRLLIKNFSIGAHLGAAVIAGGSLLATTKYGYETAASENDVINDGTEPLPCLIASTSAFATACGLLKYLPSETLKVW